MVCPYHYSLFMSRSKEINLILAPFDYALNQTIREKIGLELTGNILIFDEAHNVETKAEDCFSYKIKISDLMFFNVPFPKCTFEA